MKKFLNSILGSLLIALSLSVFSNVATTQAAFGASPAWVKTDRLMPGTTFEETVYLSRNEPSKAMKLVIRHSGDEELAKWISIPDKDNLIMDVGENILPLKVLVTAPEDAELRKYTGGLLVTMEPLVDAAGGGGQVAIGLGVGITVDVEVIGNEIKDFEVRGAYVEAIEKDDPLTVTVTVQNTGNVALTKIDGAVDIYERDNPEKLKTLPFVQPIEPLAFNETRKIEMVYEDLGLEPGMYWVEVNATKNGEVFYENRLYQKVEEEFVPVVTPEDVAFLPSDEGEVDIITPEDQIPSPSQQGPVIPARGNLIYIFLFIGLAIFVVGVIVYVQRL